MLSKIKTSQKFRILVLGSLLVLLFLFLKLGIFSKVSELQKDSSSPVVEITEIKATRNLQEQIRLYKSLIERVGPEEAQIELFKSGLPFTGETHLLNHVVGDYLYEKYGPAGLLRCKDYFLSSCYHGFILHAIAEGGMPQVVETFKSCLKEGPTVSSQCAHAIGHGFLANLGYKNLIKALETCDEAVATMSEFPTFNCYDGVFMENIWAVHEGEPSPDRWVKPDDFLYPCNDARIAEKYILACWSNQPSLVYQLLQGDIKKVGEVCEKVANEEYQQMCFDGLARQIHPLTEGQSFKTLSLCNLMPSSKWVNFCIVANAGASYSVGDRDVPYEICDQINNLGKSDCYNRIFSMMQSYKKPGEDFKKLCTKISDPNWRKECQKVFS